MHIFKVSYWLIAYTCIVLRPVREYFTHTGTPPLPVIGCKIEAFARHLRPFQQGGVFVVPCSVPAITRDLGLRGLIWRSARSVASYGKPVGLKAYSTQIPTGLSKFRWVSFEFITTRYTEIQNMKGYWSYAVCLSVSLFFCPSVCCLSVTIKVR